MIMESTLFSGATPLLLFLAKATLLLVAALVGTMTLRRSTAGARHLVWLAALVGVLALPLLARIPALQIGILPTRMATSELRIANSEVRSAPGDAQSIGAGAAVGAPEATTASPPSFTPAAIGESQIADRSSLVAPR